jgi:homoserine kinase
VRSQFIPGYRKVKARVLEAGAYGCNVSGGGSSVFAVAEGEKALAEIAGVLKTHFDSEGIENEVVVTKASNEGICEVDGF